MHSFHPSRGRTLFEVVCISIVAASCVGAWMQTHASALLGVAAAAALYGLVHLFDLRRPKAAKVEKPQRVEFEPEAADVMVPDIVVPMVSPQVQPFIECDLEESEPAEEAGVLEPAVEREGAGRRTGGSRKGSGRRGKAKETKKVDMVPVVEVETPWPSASNEASVVELELPADEEFVFEDSSTPHIAPLFEPEPYARMPRRAFGRRGRI